jgi:hypothetical protein
MTLTPGEFYDGTIVPSGCGFYRNKNGKLYLKLTIESKYQSPLVYAWWVSGELAKSLKDALPQMGVDVQAAGMDFYRQASRFIQPVACRFKIVEDTKPNTGRTTLKIGGVYFGSGGNFGGSDALDDEDVATLHRVLGDDDLPF